MEMHRARSSGCEPASACAARKRNARRGGGTTRETDSVHLPLSHTLVCALSRDVTPLSSVQLLRESLRSVLSNATRATQEFGKSDDFLYSALCEGKAQRIEPRFIYRAYRSWIRPSFKPPS
jgi:hypothetical protein